MDADIRQLLAGELRWQRLIAMSLAEGAQPVLGRRIRAAGVPVDPAASEVLQRLERLAEFRMSYLHRRLLEALEVLAGGGVSVMLLKGAALVHTTYRSASDRPMADLDLLIQPHEVDRAWRLLLDAGWAPRLREEFDGWYETMHHRPPLRDTRAPQLEVGLDLHTELIPSASNPFRWPTEEIWRAAQPVSGLPEGVLAPSPVHRLLHCCLHYAWSHMMRVSAWRSYRDVAAICREDGLDWNEFVEAAERSLGDACCYWTLRLARSLAGADVPEFVLDRLRPRLPEPLLQLLERHFRHEAVEADTLCPSLRLRKLMWWVAVRAGRRGSRSVRPWAGHAQRPWHLVKEDAPTREAGRRARPLLSARAWLRYAQALL